MNGSLKTIWSSIFKEYNLTKSVWKMHSAKFLLPYIIKYERNGICCS